MIPAGFVLLLFLIACENHCERPVSGPCAYERTFEEGAEFNICCNCAGDGIAVCIENSANDIAECSTSALQFDPESEDPSSETFEIEQRDIAAMAELCAVSDTGI